MLNASKSSRYSEIKINKNGKEVSLEGFPYYFSVAIYCFEGAGMILSLEDSLADEIKSKFKSYFVKTITGIIYGFIHQRRCFIF